MFGILTAMEERLLSSGQRAAIKTFKVERHIARYHKQGLQKIRRESLMRPARLNLGCGEFPKQGFLNLDMFPGGDLTLDLRQGLPFEPDCCELIFSEHCFEHFDYPEPISTLLRSSLAVLRPGGELRFSVPDTEWPLKEYRDGDEAEYFRACRENNWHPKNCTTRLERINYHFRQDGEHRFAYDFETAEKLLKSIGFTAIQRATFDPALDSAHRQLGSLFISARKPG